MSDATTSLADITGIRIRWGGDGGLTIYRFVNGAGTLLAGLGTGGITSPGPGAKLIGEAGELANGAPRYFRAKIGTAIRLQVTEVGIASGLGAAYRRWGHGGLAEGHLVPLPGQETPRRRTPLERNGSDEVSWSTTATLPERRHGAAWTTDAVPPEREDGPSWGPRIERVAGFTAGALSANIATNYPYVTVGYTGSGTLSAVIKPIKTMTAAFTAAGVLSAEYFEIKYLTADFGATTSGLKVAVNDGLSAIVEGGVQQPDGLSGVVVGGLFDGLTASIEGGMAMNTVVIGAGHAGLAMSRCLADRGVEHVVLERGRLGERWRTARWDSFRLLTPAWMMRLPGYAYAGENGDAYLTAPELVGYLGDYARSFAAPVHEMTTVTRVSRDGADISSAPTAATGEAPMWSSRPDTTAARSFLPWQPACRRRWSSSTRPATGVPNCCPTAQCWSSARRRRGFRSPTNWPSRAGTWFSPSGRTHGCPGGTAVATSCGGSIGPVRWTGPSTTWSTRSRRGASRRCSWPGRSGRFIWMHCRRAGSGSLGA